MDNGSSVVVLPASFRFYYIFILVVVAFVLVVVAVPLLKPLSDCIFEETREEEVQA
jgi:hypothetical protein